MRYYMHFDQEEGSTYFDNLLYTDHVFYMNMLFALMKLNLHTDGKYVP